MGLAQRHCCPKRDLTANIIVALSCMNTLIETKIYNLHP